MSWLKNTIPEREEGRRAQRKNGRQAAPGAGLRHSLASCRKRRYRPKKSLQRLCQSMNKSSVTVKGYVTAVPRSVDERQARVAVVQDDVEYRVMPRGAGMDLADEVSVPVEVTGLVEEVDGVFYLTVRGYKVLEDDSWLEE